MKDLLQRFVVAIPILFFFELVVMILSISAVFYFVGEKFNSLNNEGIGNVMNAAGIIAAFYIVYGYSIVRIATAAASLMVRDRRRQWVAFVSAVTFGGYSLLFMRPVSGPESLIWLAWAIVILFNLGLPFILPKGVFD